MIGLYSLGGGWIFTPQLKHGNEQALLSKIAGANEVTGYPNLNSSLLECLAELQNIPSYVGRWLVTLSDTVDLEYGARNSMHNPNCNKLLLVLASNTSSQEHDQASSLHVVDLTDRVLALLCCCAAVNKQKSL